MQKSAFCLSVEQCTRLFQAGSTDMSRIVDGSDQAWCNVETKQTNERSQRAENPLNEDEGEEEIRQTRASNDAQTVTFTFNC